jgi:hypothetical protein
MQEIEAMQEMAGVAGLGSPIRSRRAVPAHAVLAAAIRSTALLCILITGARGATEAEACAEDLEAIPGFLQANDAGAKDELARWGGQHFDDALASARREVARVQDGEECRLALNAYLKAWRKGHLLVVNAGPRRTAVDVDASRSPTIRALSKTTVLLTVPSFAGQYRQPLITLIARHHEQLRAHTRWIIDVRGNDGGADDTYYPLLSWLMPDELQDIGAQWLATPANIEGERQRCPLYAPGDKNCENDSAEALRRMQSVAIGSYVQQEDGPVIRHARVAHVEPSRPARVAVLMDSRCASSCEEFLMTVRQSFAVKLIGRPSRGSLDYSNLRPHDLPSGERVLRYAISRSERLPDLPVDPSGVEPDIYMPEPSDAGARHNEELQVRHWLESGSFAPHAR